MVIETPASRQQYFAASVCRYTNGAFYIDMPRGCVTVMEKGGYAAVGVKHCVRPVDMAGVG